MRDPSSSHSDDLLDRARLGEAHARDELFARHRLRLRRMVELRMDRRLSPRLDPSDVVQDALIEAHRQFPEYLQEQPLPFYPWLRQIAWNRLLDLYRRHVLAGKRSVAREEKLQHFVPDESILELAGKFVYSGTSPSGKAAREERRARVRQALLQMRDADREVLVLRYLEQLSTAEIASVLGIREGAVKVRHFRALERLRRFLDFDLT